MDKNLRAQVAETVSVIAGYEFPERWDGLVRLKVRPDQLCLYAISQLDFTLNPAPDAYAVNLLYDS